MKTILITPGRALLACATGFIAMGLHAQTPASPTQAPPVTPIPTTTPQDGGIRGQDSNGNNTTGPQNRNQNGKDKGKQGDADRTVPPPTPGVPPNTPVPVQPTIPNNPNNPNNPANPANPNNPNFPNQTPSNPTNGPIPPNTPVPVR